MIIIILILIESLFECCDNLSDFWGTYQPILTKYRMVSINHMPRFIEADQINNCYALFKQSYNPAYFDSFFEENTVLIATSSEQSSKKYQINIKANIIFFSNEQFINFCIEDNYLSNYIRIVTHISKIEECSNKLEVIKEKKISAQKNMDAELYDNASRDYKFIADNFYSLGLVCTARNYYAYAAITAERTEKWRKISYLWYCAYEPLINEHDYQDFNSLKHSYPSISLEKWMSFDESEKKGRALQYAAYSDDNHNGPSDSYWIFEAAAYEYLQSGNYERAVECAVSATNRYAHNFHMVSSNLLALWKLLLKDPKASTQEKLLYVSLCDIYRNLNLYKSEDADFFYVECKKIQEKQLLTLKKYGHFILNKVWSSLTYYGTNISRITILSVLLVLVVFPSAYFLCQPVSCDISYPLCINALIDSNILQHFLNCINISLDIFFSINSPPEATGIFRILILIETFYAYVALVIISSSIIGKLLSQKI